MVIFHTIIDIILTLKVVKVSKKYIPQIRAFLNEMNILNNDQKFYASSTICLALTNLDGEGEGDFFDKLRG